MIKFRYPRKLDAQAKNKEHVNAESVVEEGMSRSLEENIEKFKKLFDKNDTFIMRNIQNRSNPDIKCCLIFFDGMVDSKIMNLSIVQPICDFLPDENPPQDMLQFLADKVIQANDVKNTQDLNAILESILYGDTLLLLDGSPSALIINTKGFLMRSIAEPDTEKSLVGPREGFMEAFMVNLSLIRRRIKSKDLKFQFRTFGVRTRTKVCICYIDGIVKEKILQELMRRLDSYDLDGVLDSEYLREFITDAPYSPFSTIGSTERPDVVAGKILEGRIALIVDGTPIVLTLPFLFMENLQSNEDYYINYYIASFNRVLRIISLLLTVGMPAVYLSLITFHQELIPSPLLLSISASRQGVPFPSIIELLGLLLVFDVLRETGIRMPTNIGQAFSIVGALVLGQAAVQAKFVSATIVIIVAVTGITSLMLPRMASSMTVCRLLLIVGASVIGLYGVAFIFAAILIHLFTLRSFGVPFMSYVSNFKNTDIKDTVIRAPWWYMNYRPRFIAEDRKRKTKEDNRA